MSSRTSQDNPEALEFGASPSLLVTQNVQSEPILSINADSRGASMKGSVAISENNDDNFQSPDTGDVEYKTTPYRWLILICVAAVTVV